MKIAIGTDHNGVYQKRDIINALRTNSYEVIDCSYDNTDTDDYPDFAERVAKKVASGEADLGILMCGTGIGMSIAANKIKGIRCAHVSSTDEAELARLHNNANIVALSYKNNDQLIHDLVMTFVKTDFSNEERHIRRINKITALESNNE